MSDDRIFLSSPKSLSHSTECVCSKNGREENATVENVCFENRPSQRSRGWHWQACRVVKSAKDGPSFSFSFAFFFSLFFLHWWTICDSSYFPFRSLGEFVYNHPNFFFAFLCYWPRYVIEKKKSNFPWNPRGRMKKILLLSLLDPTQ